MEDVDQVPQARPSPIPYMPVFELTETFRAPSGPRSAAAAAAALASNAASGAGDDRGVHGGEA